MSSLPENGPNTIEGLRIWLPDDTFREPYNIIAWQEGLTQLTTMDVKNRPDEGELYCGDRAGIIYQTVDEEAVGLQLAILHDTEEPYACLQAGVPIEVEGYDEEARVRALHLALTRACLFAAFEAANSKNFMAATRDFVSVLRMIKTPIYTPELINNIGRENGLVYYFSNKARQHKSISEKGAKEIADAIVATLTDPYDYMKNSHPSLVKKIGFNQRTLKYVKTPGNIPRTGRIDSGVVRTSTNISPATKASARKTLTETKNTVEEIISRVDASSRHVPRDEKRKALLARIKESSEEKIFKDLSEDDKLEIAYRGILAYFGELSKREFVAPVASSELFKPASVRIRPERPPVRQIYDYLQKRKKDERLTRIINAGNYLTQRINEEGGFGSSHAKRPLPGLGPVALADSFVALRTCAQRVTTRRSGEPEALAEFGEILEAFLRHAFPKEVTIETE